MLGGPPYQACRHGRKEGACLLYLEADRRMVEVEKPREKFTTEDAQALADELDRCDSMPQPPTIEKQARSTYMRTVPKADAVDVYRVALAFGVTDPCLFHALKKIMCPGQRKAGKSARQDIEEAIYSLQRWCEMRDEEAK
jgi:hypothetical protein